MAAPTGFTRSDLATVAPSLGAGGYTGGRFQTAKSGTYFEPWQEDLAKSSANYAKGILDQGPGEMGFDTYTKWGGETPEFTKITPQGVYSPELMRQASNAIWGSALAQGENQARQANSLRPGMGSQSPFLQELQAGIRARAAAGGQKNMLDWQQTASEQNARNLLSGQKLNLGAETAAAQAAQNRLQLMQGVRGQDIQRENALMRALGQYTQPLNFSQNYEVNPGWRIRQ